MIDRTTINVYRAVMKERRVPTSAANSLLLEIARVPVDQQGYSILDVAQLCVECSIDRYDLMHEDSRRRHRDLVRNEIFRLYHDVKQGRIVL